MHGDNLFIVPVPTSQHNHATGTQSVDRCCDNLVTLAHNLG
jgi:hypothetical protein